MTVTEYLAVLNGRAEFVGPQVAIPLDGSVTGGDWTLYEVWLVVELPNGTYQGIKQGFYVYDEGGGGEAVYPVARESQNNPPSVLVAQLRTWIDNNMIDATTLKVTIDTVNEENEFAIVTAYELDTGVVSPQRYFLYRDGGVISHEYSG